MKNYGTKRKNDALQEGKTFQAAKKTKYSAALQALGAASARRENVKVTLPRLAFMERPEKN